MIFGGGEIPIGIYADLWDLYGFMVSTRFVFMTIKDGYIMCLNLCIYT